MKEEKTCQECGMEFRSKGVLVDINKSLIVTVKHGNDISGVTKQN